MHALIAENRTLTDPNISKGPHGLLLLLSGRVLVEGMDGDIPPLKVEHLECEVVEPRALSGTIPVQPFKKVEQQVRKRTVRRLV